MEINYLGHSAFEINIDGKNILIDPFLEAAPNYKPENIYDIFVTHAHSDHLGRAIEISKQTGAPITAVFELANYCAKHGVHIKGINIGATISYSWGKATAVPAFHSSSTPDGMYGGCPCGYVFDIDGCIVYHAGDTSLNAEMKIIGEYFQPDVVMLPVGGTFTMDIEQAVKAAEWLGASEVIPMHYNTFDAIKVNIEDFERQIREIGKIPRVLKIKE